MGLPGKRLSSRRRKTRAAHHALKSTTLTKCSKCNKPVLPHTACGFCGYYKGRNIFAKTTTPKRKLTEKKVTTAKVETIKSTESK